MIKKMTCIECPQGCLLEVDIEGGHIIKLSGHKCPKGEIYAKQEVENPERILTSTVLTHGLAVKMLPVRTSRPIPKARLFEAMEEIKKVRLSKPVKVGDIVSRDFLGSGADLIATRSAKLR